MFSLFAFWMGGAGSVPVGPVGEETLIEMTSHMAATSRALKKLTPSRTKSA
jgi:hypothetical protein